MINKYLNPWADDLNIRKPKFYENSAPCIMEHRGVKVFKINSRGFDFVFHDCCIAQRAGAANAIKTIDSILDGNEPVSAQVKKIFPFLKTYEDFN